MKNNYTENGDDAEFLADKDRQRVWEEQVWARAEQEEVLGDWKGSVSTYSTGSWTWRGGAICVTDSYASVPFF